MNPVLVIVPCVLALVGLVLYIGHRFDDLSQWHPVDHKGQRMMGRKVNGAWSYRAMTADEYNEDFGDRAV